MNLPKNVQQKGPTLYYVKYNKKTKKNEWTRLCAASEPPEVMHGLLWKLLRRGVDTLGDVIDDYRYTTMTKLALTTQKEYGYVLDSRLIPHFGHMHPEELKQQDIAVYLEMREREGCGVAGNREMSVLSSVFNHGLRIRACHFNPTYGVRRNREKARTYYVEDESLRLALRNANPSLRHLLWAAYLTGFRQGDLRRLTKENIVPDGIKLLQSKDGKHELREWTESLRKVVRRALERAKCQHIFTNESGQAFSQEAIKSAMQRLKTKTGIEWHYHDLRAKADSDHESGLGLMRRYNRARRLSAVK